MTNSLLQRTTVTILANKSGGAVAYGDIVILGTANDKAFTTTTTAGYQDSLIGVVIEPAGIANNASGKIATCGWVPQINLNTACSRYDFIKTHTVAGQGTHHAAPFVAGDFAIALQASATPEAILFGAPKSVVNGAGIDTTALHLDDTGQLDALTEETTPASGDWFMMEDGSTGALKKVDSDNLPGGTGGAITLIAEATPSGTGTVSFTSIPGTYRHLRIEMTGRSTKAAVNVEDMNMEFNTDTTAANYRYAYFQLYGAALTAPTVGDDRIMARFPAASSPSNSPGSYTFDIPYYADTTFNKVVKGQGAMRYDNSATQLLALDHWMEWENAAAITQIDLKLPSGNWVAGTKIALYGIS